MLYVEDGVPVTTPVEASGVLVVHDCPDVIGVAVPVSPCPLDIITALNPSPSGMSMIVPVAPTSCTTPWAP